MIALTVLKTLAQYALVIFALLSFWPCVRAWCQFFLKEPYKPAPRWIERLRDDLPNCLWLFVLLWLVDDPIRFIPQADGKSLFVAGFLGFFILICFAAPYSGPEKNHTPLDLPTKPSRLGLTF